MDDSFFVRLAPAMAPPATAHTQTRISDLTESHEAKGRDITRQPENSGKWGSSPGD
jgi:hypothetical protein